MIIHKIGTIKLDPYYSNKNHVDSTSYPAKKDHISWIQKLRNKKHLNSKNFQINITRLNSSIIHCNTEIVIFYCFSCFNLLHVMKASLMTLGLLTCHFLLGCKLPICNHHAHNLSFTNHCDPKLVANNNNYIVALPQENYTNTCKKHCHNILFLYQ